MKKLLEPHQLVVLNDAGIADDQKADAVVAAELGELAKHARGGGIRCNSIWSDSGGPGRLACLVQNDVFLELLSE